MKINKPHILAPAGDKNSFLAAMAAGADAIYCGLKIFSARMEADNFSIEELSRLSKLAKQHHIKLYIAFNSIIKEGEQEKAFKILNKLVQHVDVDALIVQDLAMISLARKSGFKGEFHLSTLGNMTFPIGMETVKQMGFSKLVLPREMTIDEIKEMADQAPKGLDLEVFIHGALCYGISGRCYWSSWFGGKSGLRGRCVQPCRRMYLQKGQNKRFFSCMDFSVDVLAKILKEVPCVTTWKIEGRKKSPHYVYYTVKAFQMLRDDPKLKKEALGFLDYAM
ncbi:MAG: U32 family peptidase, partial [Desulfobacteraceae bacterium]|nr:U32 family peptidase [Desulfobacteraceae bacterium]